MLAQRNPENDVLTDDEGAQLMGPGQMAGGHLKHLVAWHERRAEVRWWLRRSASEGRSGQQRGDAY